ncbi:helix-turn-helix domain-containing protein [Novispirillum sp. DQ9]|uniref:helix-turn-helix domain-containing protein n=1 Tax=Novispirillum sp. DQ9 TaxID=3398612 RepID=UPI003C7A4552
MSSVFDSIMRGAEQALAYAEGRPEGEECIAHVPDQVDVKAIRKSLGMTQAMFCLVFGFPLDTVKKWERGARQPEGPARAYLTVISKKPDAVREALSG